MQCCSHTCLRSVICVCKCFLYITDSWVDEEDHAVDLEAGADLTGVTVEDMAVVMVVTDLVPKVITA